jgi:hypothetical protein
MGTVHDGNRRQTEVCFQPMIWRDFAKYFGAGIGRHNLEASPAQTGRRTRHPTIARLAST